MKKLQNEQQETGETRRRVSDVASLLSEDVLQAVMEFVGPGHFRFVGGTSSQWYHSYKKIGFGASTSMKSVMESVSRCQLYLAEHPKRNDAQKQICQFAALHGNLNVLQWAREHGYPWTAKTCAFAARGGHWMVLKWARENGCEWDERTCHLAAAHGHLHILQWARENGCEWCSWTCAFAAKNGHLDILKWARENGCEWDRRTCHLAAANGQLEVLQWARENGCDDPD